MVQKLRKTDDNYEDAGCISPDFPSRDLVEASRRLHCPLEAARTNWPAQAGTRNNNATATVCWQVPDFQQTWKELTILAASYCSR
ncbi:uncharacterized protein N7473_009697 [Penicillium subrubescens]|uniref:uncharacterized protein n=1 Tax=Penicillium subrubescens TaxID=1316194 RepID=UPI0025450683|nr:uncharacterized protein N7473_009697 [Penicillium subrubescens]KAJ5887023.1 hypothetical protein N7473_009697 [Penicillium subrubescens]